MSIASSRQDPWADLVQTSVTALGTDVSEAQNELRLVRARRDISVDLAKQLSDALDRLESIASRLDQLGRLARYRQ
ncbi:MAG: hypothetical protein U0821_27165 [Chloroflexota bacterium]